VKLQRKQPPARRSRKVRPYADEIVRLQAEGYTFDEIRLALADVGVVVSRSTVAREAVRALHRSNAMDTAPISTTAEAPATTSADRALPLPSPRLQPGESRSARQIAEDFMKDQVINPLLRTERTGR